MIDHGGGVVHVFRWLPGLQAVRSYRREWLAKDIIAGVVLTTLLVPQGMAYAELAGLPPITGLYTSILCLLGYAVFGPSRILVLGPDSSLGPMIAATILPLVARQRRRQAGDRAGVDARAHGGGDHDRGGRGEARLRRRPDLQADDDRLHERPGADHPGRPAAETIRVQGRRRGPDRRGHRLCQGTGPRRGGRRRRRGRDRRDRADPGTAAVAAESPGRADHGRARDRGDDGVQPRRSRCQPGRGAPQGVPAADHPARRPGRPRAAVRRGAGHRAGLAGRHDLHRVGVRGPHRAGGPRQRRDDRDRRGEPGRRARSRASRSAPAGHGPRWPNAPGPRPS